MYSYVVGIHIYNHINITYLGLFFISTYVLLFVSLVIMSLEVYIYGLDYIACVIGSLCYIDLIKVSVIILTSDSSYLYALYVCICFISYLTLKFVCERLGRVVA